MKSSPPRSRFFIHYCFFLLVLAIPLMMSGFDGPSRWTLSKPLAQFRNPTLILLATCALLLLKASLRERVKLWMNGGEEPTAWEAEVLKKITIAFFMIAFLKATLLDYASLSVNAIDFSMYDFAMRNTLRGRLMEAVDGTSHLGIHATYILFGLLPLHALVHDPVMSLLCEPILLAIAAFPIWRMSRELPDSLRNLILLAYFLSTWVAKNLHYHFHVEVFYIPFFLWLHAFVSERRFRAATVTALLILLVKEDGGFYLAAYALALAVARPRERRWGIAVAIGACLFVVLNLALFLPYFRGGQAYELVGAAGGYGKTPLEVIHALPSLVPQVLRDFFTGEWWKMLFSFLFLPVFSLLSALPLLVLAGIHSLAQSPVMKGLQLYYSAPFIPFLWIGWVETLSGRGWIFASQWTRYRYPLTALVTILVLSLGSGYLIFRPIPLASYEVLETILDEITPKDRICAQASVIPRLPYVEETRLLSTECVKDPGFDRYLLAKTASPYPFRPEDIQAMIVQLGNRADLHCEHRDPFVYCRRN